MGGAASSSESLERAALVDLHAAVSPELRREYGLELHDTGAALVSVCRSDPSILLNRTLCLGISRPATLPDVLQILDIYRQAGIGRYYVHLVPDAEPRSLRGWLTESGLRRGRGWMKFHRSAGAPPASRTNLEVRRIGREHAIDFGRIVTAGFGMCRSSIPLLAALVEREHWHTYLSFDGSSPAGAGALYLHQGRGWLDWSATLPDFRRRGSQSAILAQRLADGLEMGAVEFATETGEAVEGDPQHSYGNILRAGFEEEYLRENWQPSGE